MPSRIAEALRLHTLDAGPKFADSGQDRPSAAPLPFRLAHLSDPHVGPILKPRLRELAGKRLTGYLNYRRGRHHIHDMEMLERITADMLEQKPDHVALTGDLVNIGLESEFVTAQRYVERIGRPDYVSVIPGNHDAYVRSSFRYMAATAAPWMADDGTETASFPYVRRRDGVALIGLSSGVPTAPLLASGHLGEAQIAALRKALSALRTEGLLRVIMIHHPPVMNGASFGRGLRDAAAFETAIRMEGAELVIHGHNHRHSVKKLPGPSGEVPVVGVASASAVPGSPKHMAAWHLYELSGKPGAAKVSMRVRGLLASGAIGDVMAADL
jgi:3',5'-cyclic AMP phosphodiesterase CpdA